MPGVPTNCIGDIADAPPVATAGIDDAGAGTGGATGVGTDGGRGITAGPCEGAAGAGSGGGRGKMCFILLFL